MLQQQRYTNSINWKVWKSTGRQARESRKTTTTTTHREIKRKKKKTDDVLGIFGIARLL
jgi:hypothetical protein